MAGDWPPSCGAAGRRARHPAYSTVCFLTTSASEGDGGDFGRLANAAAFFYMRAIVMNDPRVHSQHQQHQQEQQWQQRAKRSDVGCIAFYYPGRMTPWDQLCRAPFLGNFWYSSLTFVPPALAVNNSQSHGQGGTGPAGSLDSLAQSQLRVMLDVSFTAALDACRFCD